MTTPLPQPASLQARLPADVDAPDRVLADLTARQVAVLAVTAAALYLAWQTLHTRVPLLVLAVAAVPVAALAVVVAVGRRDGLALEAWLGHAARYWRAPRRLLPARVPPPPAWAPATPRPLAAGVLRLPADAVTLDGVIHLSRARQPTAVALVGVSTVTLITRAPAEQAALVAGFAGWLNGLTHPVQVLVSQRRVDLIGHASRIAETVHLAGDPALARAGLDHAEFLLDLLTDADPLARTVTVAATATGRDADVSARRAGERTAAALAALGATTAVLDGPTATAALTAAADPYQPGDAAWPRAVPGHPITTREHAEVQP